MTTRTLSNDPSGRTRPRARSEPARLEAVVPLRAVPASGGRPEHERTSPETRVGWTRGLPWPLRTFDHEPRDVLIVAAHPDDCVILGAEYAHGALAEGRTVRIVYMTCGDPSADPVVAQTRRKEAIEAWGGMGVPEAHLTFLDLRESPWHGPACYSSEHVDTARRAFTSCLRALPRDAAVILPAAGELHVDHRTVRRAALDALVASGRTDLIVYESPEYNKQLSLRHCPARTLWAVLRQVPGISRLTESGRGASGFVDGPVGAAFRDPTRLATKRRMLGHFASQDPELLTRSFGHRTVYRVLDVERARNELDGPRGIRAFGFVCDASALALGVGVGAAIFGMAAALGDAASRRLGRRRTIDVPVCIASVLGGCLYGGRAARNYVSKETAWLAGAAALGLATGVIGGRRRTWRTTSTS